MKDYRDVMRAKGRAPMTAKVRNSLRVPKAAGEVEIAWNPVTGEYEKYVHEGECPNVVMFPKNRRAA